MCVYLTCQQTKTHTMTIQATTRQALANQLESIGAIPKGDANYCATVMTYAKPSVNNGNVWFGMAQIRQTTNGWTATIDCNHYAM